MRFASALFLALLFLFPFTAFAADNTRTDTFDVAHYNITLDISNLASQQIAGNTVVTLTSKINNLGQVKLDLLQLTIDSVKLNDSMATYTYNDTLLTVNLASALNTGDTARVQVFYHGEPQQDGSWGGFYFNGAYAFNMGVAFTSEPHNYGRVWYPCVDNFIDKALYDFYITTSAANRALCNGLLVGQVTNPNTSITWHWHMDKVISTYLSSVAIAPYAPVQWTYNGIADTFPVILAAPAADTLKMVQSFMHLNDCIEGFELAYGPQPFERVGFTQVPFGGGAMEHAGNIAYPQFAVTGSLDYEELYAHELSHHWWGDMVTCKTAEDMWLNEGWASFSGHLFYEHVYGKESYKKRVRENHLDVLQYTHIKDDGFRAVSGVPHDYTYGSTVYDKGADVAHTLRGYLGDTIFFDCLRSYLQTFAYQNVNSTDFKNFLTSCSGKDMTAFFDNWVFAAGFPQFSIDSFAITTAGGSSNVTVYIRQKLKAATQYYNNVPLDISFYDANRNLVTRTVEMSGRCGVYQATLPFEPVYVALDMDEKIGDAITDKYLLISSNGTYDFEEALMEVNVTTVTDTALLRVEHNYVYPDPLKTAIPGLHISRERYWKVDGVLPAGFQANATILYNGTTSTSGGYLDNELLVTGSEDSLVLLYRPSVKADWAEAADYDVMVQTNTTNRRGEIVINTLLKGEYALAMRAATRPDSTMVLDAGNCITLGTFDLKKSIYTDLKVSPNPATDSFRIEWRDHTLSGNLRIYDPAGKLIRSEMITGTANNKVDTCKGWARGIYLLQMDWGKGEVQTGKLVVE